MAFSSQDKNRSLAPSAVAGAVASAAANWIVGVRTTQPIPV
jgi:hypothetical protein